MSESVVERMEIWSARFAIIDRIRASIPDYPEEEVDADIAEALAAVRANRHRPER